VQNAYTCTGDRLCGPDGVSVECGALGLPCTREGSQASCKDTNANGSCPMQACAGQYMLIDLGNERAYVDCATLGYSTCVEPFPGLPRCSP